MELFTASYLSPIASKLAMQILASSARRIRDSIKGTEKEQALQRCLEAGIVAILTHADTQSKEEADLLSDIFKKFFEDEDVAKELGLLLFKGAPMDREELLYLFQNAGYDAETLPGLDFNRAITYFEAAFFAAAMSESILQGTIQTSQVLQQTHIQKAILAEMRQMVEFLKESRMDSLRIQQQKITAIKAGSNEEIIYELDSGKPPPIPDAERAKADKLRKRYLGRLRKHCQVLPLAALGGDEGAEQELKLDHVYIDLDTMSKKEKSIKTDLQRRPKDFPIDDENPPITVLEAAGTCKRLVLLGDPGSGKSTFVRKLSAWIAAANLDKITPPPGFSSELLPFLVDLRYLAPALGDLKLNKLSGERQRESLANAVKDFTINELNRFEAADFADDMIDAWMQGQCLLVLDGLDEVPLRLRSLIRRAVNATVTHFDLEKIIITCRIRSYTGESVIPNFKSYTIAPFDERKSVLMRRHGTMPLRTWERWMPHKQNKNPKVWHRQRSLKIYRNCHRIP